MTRPPPPRVLQVTKTLDRGGAESLIVDLLRRSHGRSANHEVAYMVAGSAGFEAELRSLGVELHRLTRTTGPVGLLLAAVRLWPLLDRRRNEVVHLHSPLLGAVARLVTRLRRRGRRPRIVTTEHNEWRTFHPATRWLNARTIVRDDHVFAVSTAVRDSTGLTLRPRVEVLIHGIDLGAVRNPRGNRTEARRVLGVGPGDFVVGSVGNLRVQKNHVLLARVTERARSMGVPIVTVVAGDGECRDDLEKLSRTLGLARSFRLLGVRTDTLELYPGFDLFCMTSLWEGLPVALMEALANGCPVVATGVGGVAEALRGSVAGLLVDPEGDPAEEIARHVHALWANPRQLETMSAAALDLAKRFDGRRSTDRIVEVYRSMISTPVD